MCLGICQKRIRFKSLFTIMYNLSAINSFFSNLGVYYKKVIIAALKLKMSVKCTQLYFGVF